MSYKAEKANNKEDFLSCRFNLSQADLQLRVCTPKMGKMCIKDQLLGPMGFME